MSVLGFVSCFLRSKTPLHLPIVLPQVVPPASASYAGNRVCSNGIHANHINMVKFASNQDPGYVRTLGFIKMLCDLKPATQQGA